MQCALRFALFTNKGKRVTLSIQNQRITIVMAGVKEFSHAVPGNVTYDPINLQPKNNSRRFAGLTLAIQPALRKAIFFL